MSDRILEGIRKVLKEKQIKMEIFASEIGISAGELSKILNGKRKNYYKYLDKMLEALNISLPEIIENSISLKSEKQEAEELQFYRNLSETQQKLINCLSELNNIYKNYQLIRITEVYEYEKTHFSNHQSP